MRTRYFAVTAGPLVISAGLWATGIACAAASDARPPISRSSALPATLPRVEEQAIRKVVQGQLDAFAADDAPAAFAYASPAIQAQFGNAVRFMDVVRSGYPAVYRPARVVFLKPERYAEGVVQGVQLTDRQGDAWLATYRIRRMADKSWRIDGCVVTENKGLGT